MTRVGCLLALALLLGCQAPSKPGETYTISVADTDRTAQTAIDLAEVVLATPELMAVLPRSTDKLTPAAAPLLAAAQAGLAQFDTFTHDVASISINDATAITLLHGIASNLSAILDAAEAAGATLPDERTRQQVAEYLDAARAAIAVLQLTVGLARG